MESSAGAGGHPRRGRLLQWLVFLVWMVGLGIVCLRRPGIEALATAVAVAVGLTFLPFPRRTPPAKRPSVDPSLRRHVMPYVIAFWVAFFAGSFSFLFVCAYVISRDDRIAVTYVVCVAAVTLIHAAIRWIKR